MTRVAPRPWLCLRSNGHNKQKFSIQETLNLLACAVSSIDTKRLSVSRMQDFSDHGLDFHDGFPNASYYEGL